MAYHAAYEEEIIERLWGDYLDWASALHVEGEQGGRV